MEKKQYDVEQLMEWTKAGVDDQKIYEYLKRNIIEMNRGMTVFWCICLFMSLGLLWLNLIGEDIFVNTILLTLLSGVLVYVIYASICRNIIRKKMILDREYEVCDVCAFEIQNRGNHKECFVKDMSEQIFMDENQKKPKKIRYYGEFWDKDYTGKLMRFMDGKKGYQYILFTNSYLKEIE